MRGISVMVLAGFLLLGTTSMGVTEGADNTVSVGLLVHTDLAEGLGLDPGEPSLLVGTAQCGVEVPAGSDAGDVLDQAVADGCILEWDYNEFDGNRFVVSVDGLRAVGEVCILWELGVCQYWEFRLNGTSVGFGIDNYSAATGDQLEFYLHTT